MSHSQVDHLPRSFASTQAGYPQLVSVEFFLTIIAGTASALLAAGVLAAFYKPVREKFWKPLGRFFVWPFRVRFTTVDRMLALDREFAELGRQLAAAQETAAEAVANGKAKVDALKSLALREADLWDKQNKRLLEQMRVTAFAEGRIDALAEVELKRSLPRIQPVWRIDQVRSDEAYELVNTQQDTFATDVTLEAHVEAFAFTGSRQWTGPCGERTLFQGHRLNAGKMHGVRFTVRFRDELGDQQSGTAFLERQDIKDWDF